MRVKVLNISRVEFADDNGRLVNCRAVYCLINPCVHDTAVFKGEKPAKILIDSSSPFFGFDFVVGCVYEFFYDYDGCRVYLVDILPIK